MTAPDVAAIARGLTKAQRRILLNARETFIMNRVKCGGRSKALRRMGLTFEAWRGGDLLTPLGEEVRAHLTSEGE